MTKNHYILAATNKDGRTVFIDDVPNGKDCGCVCKECGGTLIAKNNGSIKAHHFAHKSGNDSIKCSQTALHLLAKEIIAEEKRIPAFADGGIKFVVAGFVEQEKNLGDIIPDLYAEHNGKPVAVEIFVSHAVDDEKLAKIQNHRLTTFEINLSELVFETKEDVRQALYDIKNIRLIYDEGYKIDEGSLIEYKKNLILKNGILKPIKNGVIEQCPMCGTVYGRGIVKWHNVRAEFCQTCFFGCFTEKKDIVHCIGHINSNERIPAWFFQVDVNENRILSIEETQKRIQSFKQRIRNSVI